MLQFNVDRNLALWGTCQYAMDGALGEKNTDLKPISLFDLFESHRYIDTDI